MGQIAATRNLLATKVVRLAGQQPDINTMQTNEMELGAHEKLWIEDDNHQLR